MSLINEKEMDISNELWLLRIELNLLKDKLFKDNIHTINEFNKRVNTQVNKVLLNKSQISFTLYQDGESNGI